MFALKNNIDLTNYKTIVFRGYFDYENTNSHALYAAWPVAENGAIAGMRTNYREGAAVSEEKKTAYSDTDVVLDVSALTGKHLIGVGMRSCKVRIDEWYLEM